MLFSLYVIESRTSLEDSPEGANIDIVQQDVAASTVTLLLIGPAVMEVTLES